MSLENRQRIIRELQNIRGTRIVTHINSDRRAHGPNLFGLSTKLGTEAQPLFIKTLQEIDHVDEIDLFIYTKGGQTDSVWPLVSLFREHCNKFNVIVPFKAHSGGTLICLGADELLLSSNSELSPVDPTTGNQFNPLIENGQGRRKLISVEDVTSYFTLAQNPSKREGADDKVNVDLVYNLLAQKVHPLALGKVNRSHIQIREVAKRLLGLNDIVDFQENKIDEIVNTLTQGRYSHTDILNRNEVRDLLGEEFVTFPNDDEEDLIWELFEDYEDSFDLRNPFVLYSEMGDDTNKTISLHGSFIDTDSHSYVFGATSHVTKRSRIPSNVNVQIQPSQGLPIIPGLPLEYNIELESMGWSENTEGV